MPRFLNAEISDRMFYFLMKMLPIFLISESCTDKYRCVGGEEIHLLPTAREGYVFRIVCQSFCSQNQWGGGLPMGGSTRGGVCLPTPAILAATATVGRRVTGMHSCYTLQIFETKLVHFNVL